ncbi:MAG: DUF4299 domain-containing protein [Oscillospiraceae bacterium]|nr:DUF4299 domain-containing protein [Oscillospiraceae bacterium]
MGLDVTIKQKKLFKKPLPFEVIRGDLSYGSGDAYHRLDEGKTNEDGFILFNPAHIGRGIGVEWKKGEKNKVFLRLPFPASEEDVDDFYNVVERIIAFWEADEFEQDGSILPVSIIPEQRVHIKGFNLETLNKMCSDTHGALTLYCAMNPLNLTVEEIEQFTVAKSLDNFRDYMHEKQSIDAYYAVPRFYGIDNNKIMGVYTVTEDVVSIVPKEPYLPFGVELEVDEWEVCLFSQTRNGIVGNCKYEDFISSVIEFSEYDSTHIVFKGLSLDKIDEIIDKYRIVCP